MSLTLTQRQRLVDNLTTLRRQRLRDEGKTQPLTIDAATSSQLLRDSIIFGFIVVSVSWQQRELTLAEREWDCFRGLASCGCRRCNDVILARFSLTATAW